MAATAVGLLEAVPDPAILRARRAVTLRKRAYRSRRAALGGAHVLIDPGPTLEIIARLHRKLLFCDIAAGVGMSKQHFQIMRRRTAAGGKITRETAARFEDLLARVYPPPVNLSPEPLLAYVVRRYETINESGCGRQLHRLRSEWAAGKGLSRDQADRWARRFGALEWEIWPELLP